MMPAADFDRADPPSIDQLEAELVAQMEALNQIEPPYRHAELSAWARGPHYSGALMLCEGWQGQLAREAWACARTDLEADTPSKRWHDARFATSRASIHRMLGVDGLPGAGYATAPFKAVFDGEDKPWIAAAVGISPYLDAVRARYWTHLDIREVILWDPRKNIAHVDGEAPGAPVMLLPDAQDERLTIFADPRAFFTAWAGRRARTAALAQKRAAGEWPHPINEPDDSGLPGAFITGPVDQAPWRRISAATVIAGPGTDKASLYRAAVAASGLPKFEGGDGARVH